MTEDEYRVFIDRVHRDFAIEQAQIGQSTYEAALAAGIAGDAELLPKGRHTPGQLFFVAEDEDGVVGELWLQTFHPRGVPDTAWINDIEVRPERRGQGFGRELLAAGEQRIRELGIGGLGLNVFGPNRVARRLYESSGYEVTTVQMRKPLA